MTADLEFRINDFGEVIDIPLRDADGNELDTSGYTTAVMTFYSLDRGTTLKTITNMTIPTNAVARWTMSASDTSIALETGATSRLMAGQIVFTGTGTQRGLYDFSVFAHS